MVDPVLDPERQALVAAVDRGRGRIDEMPRPPLPGELEHVAMADEVRLDIGGRVLDAVAHAGLRAEVDDAVEPVGVGQRFQRVGIGEVDPLEAEALAEMLREAVEAGLLERGIVISVEVVDADDLSPRSSRARAVAAPMKPAAPVTRTAMAGP